MHKPLEIDFLDVPASAGLSAVIRKRVGKLERMCDHIIACRVTVAAPHQHHHRGALYQAHIRLTVPGRELVASRQHGGHTHEDSYVAVRDAFDAVQRQLEDYSSVHRGEVKRHSFSAGMPLAG
jgi:ribosome-associated translation inhibitor RaiA